MNPPVPVHRNFSLILSFIDAAHKKISLKDVDCDLIFYTRANQANYMASLRTNEQRNCELLPDGAVLIYFDNPMLMPGPLKGSITVISSNDCHTGGAFRQSFSLPVDIVPEHHHEHFHHPGCPPEVNLDVPFNAEIKLNVMAPDFRHSVSTSEMEKYVADQIKNSADETDAFIDESVKKATEALSQDLQQTKSDLESKISDTSKEASDNLASTRQELESMINSVSGGAASNIDSVKKELEESISQTKSDLESKISDTSKEASDNLASARKELESMIEAAAGGASSNIDDAKKEFNQLLESAKEDVKERLRKIQRELDDGDRSAKSAIDAETTRAKGEEERIDRKVNENSAACGRRMNAIEQQIADNAAGASSAVQAEATRAMLVEKDITESLQRLKQSVQQGNISYDEAIEAAKKELKELVDYRVKEIIGEAPEALDTLEEIAAQLRQDEEAMQILKGILLLKANEEDVYKKQKIDSLLEEINNTIASERNRVNDRLSDISRVIGEEKQRAQLAEKANADAIAVINGNKETVGSIAHAIEDAKHYADDQDEVLKDSLKTVGIDKVRSWFPQKK